MDMVIQTSKLTKSYGSKTVLDSLDLNVRSGEILGYLGPNGAGKTTTIRLLLGLIKPTSGTAQVFGKDIGAAGASLHKDIAYVPGETNFWPSFTGAEVLRFMANLHGGCDETYQAELVHKFAFEPHKRIRNYSKGNRQKIALIAALASKAPLLIFDEPTSGLDPVMAKVFRDEVLRAKHNGQTVFLSSHILEEVQELCDRIGVLREGKLVELGTLDELQHLSALTIEAAFVHTPPDVTRIKNVTNVMVEGHRLRCNIHGAMDELLAVIAKARPLTLLSSKPSLEELFLDLYKQDAVTEHEN